MRRSLLFAILTLVPMLPTGARADTYVPSDPVFRPALGWACWVRHARGDFDGNGRIDRAVVWDRSGPHQTCDEMHAVARWHLEVVLGDGLRVRRPLPCEESPVFCRPSTGDLDADGRDELALETCCGAIIAERRVYGLAGARLVPIVLRGNGVGRLRPGPLVLTLVSDSATHDGFGCRTRPNGRTVVIAWTGRLVRPGRWRLERARLQGSGGAFEVVGLRRFRAEPTGDQPLGPRAEACFAAP